MSKYLFGEISKKKPIGAKRKYNDKGDLILENIYNSKGDLLYQSIFCYKYYSNNLKIITHFFKIVGEQSTIRKIYRINKSKGTEKEIRYRTDGIKGVSIKRYFNKEEELIKEREYDGDEYKGTTYYIDKYGRPLKPYFISAWREQNFNEFI